MFHAEQRKNAAEATFSPDFCRHRVLTSTALLAETGSAGVVRRGTRTFQDRKLARERDQVLVATRREDDLQVPTEDRYMLDEDGGIPRRLTRNETFEFAPACSPDGMTIAFTGVIRRGEKECV